MAAQSVLEIIIQAVDEASQELENVSNGLDATGKKALTAQQQLQAYGDAMEVAGTKLAVAGAAITAVYGGIVEAAAKNEESFVSLKASVEDIVKSANDAGASQTAYATQVAFLTDKINAQKATVAQATATLDKNTSSTAASAATHEKAAATIATATDNINKLQQQLDLLRSQEGLVGASTDDIIAKFEESADAAVKFGFENDAAESSLKNLFAATKSAPDAMSALQIAMDLARAKNEDLATATQQVIMAMQGQGRALIGVGITIKDGLSGMEALAAIQNVVGGQAQAYANTLGGQMAVALANINKLFEDMGKTQLPMLTKLFEFINNIITAVDNWVSAHPKLTEVILVFIGVLGVMLTLLGGIILTAGAVAVAIAGGLSAAFIGIAAGVAVVIAAIVALGVAIYANWTYIKNNMLAVWQIILAGWNVFWTTVKNVAQLALNFILGLFGANLTEIQTVWNAVWTGVSDFFTGIWDGIQNTLTYAISFLQGQLNSFVSWAKGIFGDILNPVQGISNLISGTVSLAKGAASKVSSVLNVHDAIITPGGQVIQTDVSDYLFATKNPGAIGGGRGGGITVNIQGGNYLDRQGATMIGNELAKLIGRQIKLNNYAS